MKTLSVSEFSYENETGQVYMQVQISGDSGSQNNFFLINYDVPKYVPPIKIPIQQNQIDSQYVLLDFNLDRMFNSTNISHNSTWYLICVENEKEYQCKIDQLEFGYYYFKEKRSYKIKPYLTKKNTVAFYIRELEVSAIIYDIEYTLGTLKGTLQYNIENMNIDNSMVSLGVKNRDNDLMQVIDSIVTPSIKNQNIIFELPLSKQLIDLINGDVLDLILIVKSANFETYQLIKVQVSAESKFDYFTCEKNEFYLIKPYITKNETLSIYVKRKNIVARVSDVTFNESNGEISLEGFISLEENNVDKVDYKAVACVLKQRNPVGTSNPYFVEKSIPLDIVGNIYSAEYSLNEVFPIDQAFIGSIWDVFIRIQGNNNVEDFPVKFIDGYKSKNYEYYKFNSSTPAKKIKPYVTGSHGLSLFISDTKEVKKNSVKVAVLGTCYSRNPFNSMPYFNPEYKDLYQVVFLQFHSSLISLTSEPVSLKKEDIGEIEDKFLPFVQRDFNKTFFEDLKRSSPDYFILDLDIDATHNLVKINDNQIVTLNYMLAKTNFLTNNQNEVTYILHHNDFEFFEMWKKSADAFISKLTEIIPEEKIILNSGRYAQKYLDSKRNIQDFPNLNWIRQRNELWEKMDHYFLVKLPKAQNIDLTRSNFIGDELYPFGNKAEPPHYESGYYKEFLRQLNMIVLSNFIDERY